MSILLFNFILWPIICFLQIPLLKKVHDTNISYNIPMIINQHDYQIGINLNNKEDYLKPLKQVKKDKKKHKKIDKNEDFTYGILAAKSIEIDSIQGWRRYFFEAILFESNQFSSQLKLQLDDIKFQQNNDQLMDGNLKLSPKHQNNKFYTQIKRNTNQIHRDIFSIYIGVSQHQHRLQLGGYNPNMGIRRNGKRFQRVPLKQSQTQWIIQAQKILLSKQKNNKWRQYMLSNQNPVIKLNLNTNKLILKKQVLSILQSSLQSQNITCKMSDVLICQNLTSIELSLHMIVFQIDTDTTINITLYRLLNSCDDQQKQCRFNIQVGEQYVLGAYFFIEYYTVFDINQHSLYIAPCNKYVKSWFNTIYIIRFFMIFFGLFLVAAVFISTPKIYENYIAWKKKQSGLQGIELVSGRQTTKMQLQIQ